MIDPNPRDDEQPDPGRALPVKATTKAVRDRATHPGGGPAGSGDGSAHAAGTPMGGSSYGGLAGSNRGDGTPDDVPLNEAMGSGVHDNLGGEESEPPYAGFSGGAVGGTPAEGRASGGRIGRGLSPGGVHRGDSTIGSNEPEGPGMSREEALRRAAQRPT